MRRGVYIMPSRWMQLPPPPPPPPPHLPRLQRGASVACLVNNASATIPIQKRTAGVPLECVNSDIGSSRRKRGV